MKTVKAFNTELSSLYELKPPISRAKMKSLTRGAIRAVKFNEHVVQSVESFILKCKPEHKIPGLYLIDSIVRQSRHQFGIDKDVFAPRFAKNIQQTFNNVYQCPPEDMSKIIRVLNLWQNNQIYPADVVLTLFNLSDPNKLIHKELMAPNQGNEHNSIQKAPRNMLTLPPVVTPKVPIGAPPTNLQEPLMTNQLLELGSPIQGAGLIPMSLANENSQENSYNNMKNQAESLMGFGQKCNMMTQPPYMSEATIMQEDNMNIKKEDTYLVHQEPCSNENDTSRDDRGNQRDIESENNGNRDRRRSRSGDSNSSHNPEEEKSYETQDVKDEDLEITEHSIDEHRYKVESEYSVHLSEQINGKTAQKIDESCQPEVSGSIQSNSKQYECNLGDYSSNQRGKLKNDIESVHLNSKKHKCNFCEYSTNFKGTLKKHIDAVHLKSKEHECHLCEYSANRKSHLENHIDAVHVNLKEHKCHMCKYSANLKNTLKKHIDAMHLNSKEYKCHLCEYSGKRKRNLKNHIEAVHLNLKEHKCPLCEFSANYKDNLKNHIDSVHLNSKEHKCHLCVYSANLKSALKNHINAVHLNLKEHKCHLCEYSAYRKRTLKQHIDAVHLNLKERKCHLCEYSANQKVSLKTHIDAVHLNSKEHKCHLCDYSANRKDYLKKHIHAVHLNLKEHKCHLCEYSANRKDYLKIHIYAVHLNSKKDKGHSCD